MKYNSEQDVDDIELLFFFHLKYKLRLKTLKQYHHDDSNKLRKW